MRTPLAVAVLSALALTGCGATTPSGEPAAAVSSPTSSASAGADDGADGYETVSDVTSHAALGGDVAAIRDLLAPAKEGGAVDWAAVGQIFTEGGASTKSDGSVRTLAALSPDSAAVPAVEAALAGASGLSDAARAQQVDKGMVVILSEKVLDELDTAAGKVAEGNTDAATGAPHNVDEAYAFYTAEGQGPAATADKREQTPELEGKVRQPVVDALASAQTAAAAGDAAALTQAAEQTASALNYIFYLAVHRYLEHEGDEVKQAEGGAFYLAIQPLVSAASPAADEAVLATLAGGDTATGREALSSPAVLDALGLEAAQKATA